jgi:hypothetical protein
MGSSAMYILDSEKIEAMSMFVNVFLGVYFIFYFYLKKCFDAT